MYKLKNSDHAIAKRKIMLRSRIGGILLILVDIIWIIFGHLTDYVFKDVHFDKPYFSTYLNYSFFTVYLFGFLFYKPWGRQCVRCTCDDDYYYNVLENTEDEDDSSQSDSSCSSFEALSQSQYIDIHLPSCPSDDSDVDCTTMRVKFSPTAEVKSLPDSTSEKIARMSHVKSRRARQTNKIMKSTRKMTFIAKYAFLFALPLFTAEYCRLLAKTKTSKPVGDILQSTAGMFTLVLGAIFPTLTADRFSVLKFIFAIMTMGGIVLISVGGNEEEIYIDASTGTILSLISALSFSIFLVGTRRISGRDMEIDVPMFFGFIGLFTLLMFWPGLVVLHLTGVESFTLPSKIEWLYLCISAVVTAVICQLLGCWASLATSPLQGILALALIVPGSKGISNILDGQPLTLKFATGTALTLISYIGVCNTNRSPRQAKVEAFELEIR